MSLQFTSIQDMVDARRAAREESAGESNGGSSAVQLPMVISASALQELNSQIEIAPGSIPTRGPKNRHERHSGGAMKSTGTRARKARSMNLASILPSTQASRAKEEDLRQAVNSKNYETAKGLLESGVDANAADDKRRTASHFCVTRGDKAMMELLIKHRADLNQRDFNGNTPLHLAACTNHMGMVTLLLEAGCDIGARDRNNRTPLHYAESHLRMLQKMGSTDVKSRVADIADMIKVYLRKMKIEESSELAVLTDALSNSSISEEVQEVTAGLLAFTTLSLQNMEQ